MMKTIFKKGDWFIVKSGKTRPMQILKPSVAKLATKMGYTKSSESEALEFDKATKEKICRMTH